MDMQPSPTARTRVELVDVARGLALVAMAIYHFVWDLDFFGYIDPGTSITGGWRIFARCIAISFLFIVGVSLYLANTQGFRRKSYIRRLAMIVAAALAITMATLLATPDAFIFFGILHHIALASVLGLAFLRLPVVLMIASVSSSGTSAASASDNSGACDIKGNISKGGERIYHVPGQKWYSRTKITTSKGERWFCSEQEARAAGWRRAKQ